MSVAVPADVVLSPSSKQSRRRRPVPYATLTSLPDDVLLRILASAGDLSEQIGAAYRLGRVCARFHHLLHTQFLPVITKLSANSLASLSLADTPSARIALSSFFHSTCGVRELNLSGCSPGLLSVGCMTSLARSASASLTKVKLAHCRISDEVIHPLLQCSSLRTVNLVSCDGPTGKIFHRATCSAPIAHLDLSWVPSVTQDGVLAIATLRTVTNLILTGCDAVCSDTLRMFANSEIRHSLTSVSLSYCPVRDEALFALLQRAPKVASLTLAEYTGNLWNMGDYTHAGIAALRTSYPHVEIRFRTCG